LTKLDSSDPLYKARATYATAAHEGDRKALETLIPIKLSILFPHLALLGSSNLRRRSENSQSFDPIRLLRFHFPFSLFLLRLLSSRPLYLSQCQSLQWELQPAKHPGIWGNAQKCELRIRPRSDARALKSGKEWFLSISIESPSSRL